MFFSSRTRGRIGPNAKFEQTRSRLRRKRGKEKGKKGVNERGKREGGGYEQGEEKGAARRKREKKGKERKTRRAKDLRSAQIKHIKSVRLASNKLKQSTDRVCIDREYCTYSTIFCQI